MAVETLASPQVQQLQQEQAGECHHKFTADVYYRMAEQGMLPPDARVELIEGEILTMSPIGVKHALCVRLLVRRIDRQLDDSVIINPQNPLRLSDFSEPEPDIAVIRHDPESNRHPSPEDVFLVVEVADTTLRLDRNRKIPVYAAASIPEVWIVDLNAAMVTRYAGPNEGAYDRQERFRRGQSLTIEALPSVTVAVDHILPKD